MPSPKPINMRDLVRGTDVEQAWIDCVVASRKAAQRDRDAALRELARVRQELETEKQMNEQLRVILKSNNPDLAIG